MKPTSLSVALTLMLSVGPAWSAGLQPPSVHMLAPAQRSHHPVVLAPRPVILGARYHLAARCSDPRRALTVTLRIRNEGGPLKARTATVRFSGSNFDLRPTPVRGARAVGNVLPAMAPGQTIVFTETVGVLPGQVRVLSGRHLLVASLGQLGVPGRPAAYPPSPCRFLVSIPADYCQVRLRPAPLGSGHLRLQARPAAAGVEAGRGRLNLPHRGMPTFPPSPCTPGRCVSAATPRASAAMQRWSAARRLPSLGASREAAARNAKVNRKLATGLAAHVQPHLRLVFTNIGPATVTSGQPIFVRAIVENEGTHPNLPGETVTIYCAASGDGVHTTGLWTCNVPAGPPNLSGMPTWNIPIPSIAPHTQKVVSLRIDEHWPKGFYYFAPSGPDSELTILGLQDEANDHQVEVKGH